MSEPVDPTELCAARDAWPGVELDLTWFASHVADCRRDGGAAPEHLADLYLACAAARADAAAIRAFDEGVLRRIDAAVRRVDAAPAFLDEVRQLVRVRLLVGEGGALPRLAEYKGRGPLVAWVRVAAARVALNQKRAEAPAEPAEELLGDLVAGDPDPEIRHLKTLYRAEFGHALRETLAALPDRARALLRLHYVDGLRLAQIAALYRVHESTVSRWVSGAAADVAEGTRRRLVERLALSPGNVDSIARMVHSQLDLSIRRLLGSG